MLRYNVNINDTINDFVSINVSTFTVVDYEDDGFDKIIVEFTPSSENDWCVKGEILTISVINEYTNDADDSGTIDDIQTIEAMVTSVNHNTGNFSILAPRFRNIVVTEINEIFDEDTQKVYWDFTFDSGHFFKPNDEIEFDIYYSSISTNNFHFDDLEYLNCKTLRWEFQNDIPWLKKLSEYIFDQYEPLSNKITVVRPQTLFDREYNHDASDVPQINVIRPRIKLDIPISNAFDTSPMLQETVNENFVYEMTRIATPDFINLEKVVYTPVIMEDEKTGKYANITKLNFNLHFMEHSGENWTVNENDEWNFSKYGYTKGNDAYYSYQNEYESCQSDLLGYLGFTNNDVRNQTKRLQKSFLRLLFYDSPNPANQNLLCYSTIFLNTGKLYSKYMKGLLLDDWYVKEDKDDVKFDNISTDYELDVRNNKIPERIKNNPEAIEDYRLSSQISVQDKYSTNTSSDGFYLYLYDDNTSPIAEHLYMKAEFTHAGYGRVIPMMFPYFIPDVEEIPTDNKIKRMSGSRFKTNRDIINDWKNMPGYGYQKYNHYSYLRLKYKYDNETRRYIYYIDPQHYGKIQGPIVNINLYESRVNF